MIATGQLHAGIFCNSDSLEGATVAAGKSCGDLCFPLVFAPELHRKEFASSVADMKNSVADRNNAQSSCAATFIYDHLAPDYSGEFLHVDLAGPAAFKGSDRGTGFGVALLLALHGKL